MKKAYKFRCNWIHILFFGILVFTFLLIFLFIVLTIVRKEAYSTALVYGGNNVLSDNGKYIGIIKGYSGQVVILNQKGERVSEFKSNSAPAEIALGEKSYFLLYRSQEFEKKSRIVQLDYQSKILHEKTVNYVNTIACRDGILFMGKWLSEDDWEYDINRFHNGFTANFYLEDENLQGEICELQGRAHEKKILEGKDLFYHSSGFYSSEPELEDYPGMIMDSFYLGEEGNGIYKRANKNQKLLSKNIMNKNNNEDLKYKIREYQKGKKIYGVCNVITDPRPGISMQINKVVKSYGYEVDCSNEQLNILTELTSSLAVYTSSTDIIYQKNNQLIKRNYESGKEDIVYKIKNMEYFSITLQGNYLLVEDNEEYIPIHV